MENQNKALDAINEQIESQTTAEVVPGSQEEKFQALLDSGDVVITQVYFNPKAKQRPWTVQFHQKFLRPVEGSSLRLVALAGGLSEDAYSTTTATALFAFNEDAMKKIGLPMDDINFREVEGAPLRKAHGIFKDKEGNSIPLRILVTENTTKNPKQDSQMPKMNPTTEEYITYKGDPVYRHTELVTADDPRQNEFLVGDGSMTLDGVVTHINESALGSFENQLLGG